MVKARFSLLPALLIGGGLVLGQDFTSQNANPSNPSLEQKVESGEKIDVEETPIYKLIDEAVIKDHIKTHIEELDNMMPGSIYYLRLRNALHKDENSKDRTRDEVTQELIRRFSVPQELCLKLAMKYEGREIPDEKYMDLGKAILKENEKLYKLSETGRSSNILISPRSNYGGVDSDGSLNGDVLKAVKYLGMLRTWEFARLMSVDKILAQNSEDGSLIGNLETEEQKQDYVRMLYQRGFGEEGYKAHVENIKRYRNHFAQALKNNIAKRPGRIMITQQIDKLRDATIKAMDKTVQKYFPN